MLEHVLKDNVKALNLVNYQIAELVEIKQQLEAKIIEGLNHDYEGSKTYDLGMYKVTIKTDYIYSLDKEEYHIYRDKIPKEFNPVKESVSYLVDKRAVKQAEQYASSEELLLLSRVLSKKPAKPNVKVSANA